MEMVSIPAGDFIMGPETGYKNEQPQRRVFVDAYAIAKFPLTNIQYEAFLAANPEHPQPKGWTDHRCPLGRENHPVVFVNGESAQVYARWLAGDTGIEFRLPTEAEWEKAARATEGNIYPWGEAFDPGRCNTRESGPGIRPR